MIGYPGLPATYREEIKTYRGKKYDRPPQSIADFSVRGGGHGNACCKEVDAVMIGVRLDRHASWRAS